MASTSGVLWWLLLSMMILHVWSWHAFAGHHTAVAAAPQQDHHHHDDGLLAHQRTLLTQSARLDVKRRRVVSSSPVAGAATDTTTPINAHTTATTNGAATAAASWSRRIDRKLSYDDTRLQHSDNGGDQMVAGTIITQSQMDDDDRALAAAAEVLQRRGRANEEALAGLQRIPTNGAIHSISRVPGVPTPVSHTTSTHIDANTNVNDETKPTLTVTTSKATLKPAVATTPSTTTSATRSTTSHAATTSINTHHTSNDVDEDDVWIEDDADDEDEVPRVHAGATGGAIAGIALAIIVPICATCLVSLLLVIWYRIYGTLPCRDLTQWMDQTIPSARSWGKKTGGRLSSKLSTGTALVDDDGDDQRITTIDDGSAIAALARLAGTVATTSSDDEEWETPEPDEQSLHHHTEHDHMAMTSRGVTRSHSSRHGDNTDARHLLHEASDLVREQKAEVDGRIGFAAEKLQLYDDNDDDMDDDDDDNQSADLLLLSQSQHH